MSLSRSFKRASRTLRALVQKKSNPSQDRDLEPIQSSALCNLPAELLLAISAFLDCSGICSFRLTCKLLHDASFPEFCTYIESVKTDLSLASLTAFHWLGSSRLCPYVRKLHMTDSSDNDILGSGLKWERDTSAGGLLIRPQESIQRWQDAILRLENCQSFAIFQHFRPCPPENNANTSLIPSDTITILVSIFASLGRPLRELSVLFKPPECTGGNQMDMTRVDKSLLQEATPIFSSLETLKLKYAMETEDEVNFAIRLIEQARNLQRLSVNTDYGTHSETFMSRLYLVQPTVELRELSLTSVHVGSGHAFSEFLASSTQSLVRLVLSGIHLDSGEWAPILLALSRFPALAYFSTYHLTEPESQTLHFPPLLDDSTVDPVLGTKFSYWAKKRRAGRRTIIVSYSGPSMDIALRKLADYATTDNF
ncbi:hypothetical protein BDV18DRAFT_128379 [Aspergillus unguis]